MGPGNHCETKSNLHFEDVEMGAAPKALRKGVARWTEKGDQQETAGPLLVTFPARRTDT